MSKIVDYVLVPMQASHVPTPTGQTRCSLCFQLNAITPPRNGSKADHFCLYNIERESPGRNPNPPMYRKPVYRRAQ